jgi:hypothetical protein
LIYLILVLKEKKYEMVLLKEYTTQQF